MKPWRQRPAVAVGLTALIVAVQLAVPLTRLGGEHERAVQFGWQMFSTVSRQIDFTVTTEGGEIEVAAGDYMANIRGDVDVVTILPPHLCEIIDGARSVTWSEETYEC